MAVDLPNSITKDFGANVAVLFIMDGTEITELGDLVVERAAVRVRMMQRSQKRNKVWVQWLSFFASPPFDIYSFVVHAPKVSFTIEFAVNLFLLLPSTVD